MPHFKHNIGGTEKQDRSISVFYLVNFMQHPSYLNNYFAAAWRVEFTKYAECLRKAFLLLRTAEVCQHIKKFHPEVQIPMVFSIKSTAASTRTQLTVVRPFVETFASGKKSIRIWPQLCAKDQQVLRHLSSSVMSCNGNDYCREHISSQIFNWLT